jgi:hypothetical protein
LPRPTRDIDLLGYGSPRIEDVIAVMKKICLLEVNDGIVFDLNRIIGEPIREDIAYHGVRGTVPASLDNARSKLQIDIGFGDTVDPGAEEKELPVILKLEPPRVKAYPPEASIAEKVQAMVYLGLANSRMKDFFDIWVLCREQSFQMARLRIALKMTFRRRSTLLPVERPTALSDVFLLDKSKNDQWKAFMGRMSQVKVVQLKSVGDALAEFLMPVITQARMNSKEEWIWKAGGPWEPIHGRDE